MSSKSGEWEGREGNGEVMRIAAINKTRKSASLENPHSPSAVPIRTWGHKVKLY